MKRMNHRERSAEDLAFEWNIDPVCKDDAYLKNQGSKQHVEPIAS